MNESKLDLVFEGLGILLFFVLAYFFLCGAWLAFA